MTSWTRLDSTAMSVQACEIQMYIYFIDSYIYFIARNIYFVTHMSHLDNGLKWVLTSSWIKHQFHISCILKLFPDLTFSYITNKRHFSFLFLCYLCVSCVCVSLPLSFSDLNLSVSRNGKHWCCKNTA